MFKVIDDCGNIYEAYGTFIDEYGEIQFILCDRNGSFYKTSVVSGTYMLCTEENVLNKKFPKIKKDYEKFIKTEDGKEWIESWKERSETDSFPDLGAYLYDFYPKLLQ